MERSQARPAMRRPERPRGPGKRHRRLILLRWGNHLIGWYYRPWVGTSPMVVVPIEGSVETALQEVRSKAMAKAPRPKPPDAAAGLPSLGASYGDWSQTIPLIAGYLCDAVYDDGTAVGRTQLVISREGTRIRARLKLERGALMLNAVGDTPPAALRSLEGLLIANDTPWETDPYPLGGLKPKKK